MVLSKENKKFLKILSTLALPIVAQELVNSLVNMLDVFMVSSLGEAAIAAVGLANQIFFLFVLLVFGINSGASAFMGQFWGKGDTKSIRKTMGICLLLSFCAAFIFASLAFFMPQTLMGIYSKDEQVIELGSKYLQIVWFSYFLTCITIVINFSLRSTGQTRIPMMTTVCALVCNALLNYIFIYILQWGVSGAAISTVIARSLEVCLQITVATKLRLPIVGQFKDYISAERQFLKRFFVVTVPVILNEFAWALGTSLYNVAYRESGTAAQSAIQIASTIQNLFLVAGISTGSACGIILSNALGAGEIEKAIRYSRKCLILAVVLSSFMGICLFLASPVVSSLFNISGEVKLFVDRLLIIICFGMVLKTFNYTTIVGILRSGGDTTFCLILDACAVWLVGVPFAFLGAYVWQLPIYWVFALAYLEEVVKLFFSGMRTFRNKWARSLVE